MKKASVLSGLVGLFALLTVSVVSAEDKAAGVKADDAMITAKCAACHKIDKVCKNIGKNDAAKWEAVVKGMVKRGAKLNEEEQKSAAEYLATLKPDSNTLCPK